MKISNADFRMAAQVPHFIIGGAPRSGTTWLYALLDKHPDIYLAKPVKPEPKFFLVDELYNQGFSHYLSKWFPDVPPGKIAGEKSTNYLENPLTAERIQRHLALIKLVFILREPASRAYSNYLWSSMNGYETEDFAAALDLEGKRGLTLEPHLRFVRPHAYFSRGLYAELLKPFFELFPREQILCLRYEDIGAHPKKLAERLHQFLGVEPRPQDARGLGIINASEGKSRKMSREMQKDIQRRYMPANRALSDLLGADFEIWETS